MFFTKNQEKTAKGGAFRALPSELMLSQYLQFKMSWPGNNTMRNEKF